MLTICIDVRTYIQHAVHQVSQLSVHIRVHPVGNPGNVLVHLVCFLAFLQEIGICFQSRRIVGNTVPGISPVCERHIRNRVHFSADVEDILIRFRMFFADRPRSCKRIGKYCFPGKCIRIGKH